MDMAKAHVLQANLIKAMAHPTRVQILDILSEGEACVCHLTTILKRRQANVSQHLMLLREAGLVRDRRDGVVIYYRLTDTRTAEALELVRLVLASTGVATEFPAVPKYPVRGCPCPKCREADSKSGG